MTGLQFPFISACCLLMHVCLPPLSHQFYCRLIVGTLLDAVAKPCACFLKVQLGVYYKVFY